MLEAPFAISIRNLTLLDSLSLFLFPLGKEADAIGSLYIQ